MSETQQPPPSDPNDPNSPPVETGTEPEPEENADIEEVEDEENPLANSNVVETTIPPRADMKKKPE